MDDNQTPLQMIGQIIRQVLDSGIVLNGEVGIKGLTITSVDNAKKLGIVPQLSRKQGEQQEQSSGKDQQKQEGESNEEGQISREEFSSLRDEIGYIRKLMESSQDSSSSQRSRQAK